MNVDQIIEYLMQINPWYGAGALVVLYAVSRGWIPGLKIADGALQSRVSKRAGSKYEELTKAGRDPDEVHAAIVKAIKEIKL